MQGSGNAYPNLSNDVESRRTNAGEERREPARPGQEARALSFLTSSSYEDVLMIPSNWVR